VISPAPKVSDILCWPDRWRASWSRCRVKNSPESGATALS